MEKAKVYFSDFRTTAGISQGAKLQKLMRRAGVGQIDFDGLSLNIDEVDYDLEVTMTYSDGKIKWTCSQRVEVEKFD